MKTTCRLLVSTCLITSASIWGAEELKQSTGVRRQTAFKTPVSAPQATQSKKTPPQAQKGRVDPNNDPSLFATYLSPSPSSPKTEPLPGAKAAQQKDLPVNSSEGQKVSKIEIPTTIPTLSFSMQAQQQKLNVNLNIQGVCFSHEADLDVLGKDGGRQVFVSGVFVTTLTPSEAEFVAIQITQQGRTIAEGRYKIDPRRRILQIDSLSLNSDIALSFDGDIAIERIKTELHP